MVGDIIDFVPIAPDVFAMPVALPTRPVRLTACQRRTIERFRAAGRSDLWIARQCDLQPSAFADIETGEHA